MDLPTLVVSVLDRDNMCRACFKELNTVTATEASARVNMLEMPGLVDKLSACISSIFITTNGGSKYLCWDCFEKVNEFYEFRDMCLQSIRRFEETQTFKTESIESEGTNDILLSSDMVIKKEYEDHDENDLSPIFEGPLKNHVVQFNKESIKTESMIDLLLSRESVVKGEFQLHEHTLDSNRETTMLPQVVNNSLQIFQDSLENQESQFKKESIETKGTKDLSLPIGSVVKEEYELHEQALVSNRDVSAKNEAVSEFTNLANKRRRSTTGNFVNVPVWNEGDKDLSSDDSRNTTSSPNQLYRQRKHNVEIWAKVAKTATERSREHRARKMALKKSSATENSPYSSQREKKFEIGGKVAKTSTERSREYRARKKKL